MANDLLRKLIQSIIEANVDVGSLSGYNPEYMQKMGYKQPETFFRHQKGDMPTSTLEQLINYTGPDILNKEYDFESRVSDVRERRKDSPHALIDSELEGLSDENLDATSLHTWFDSENYGSAVDETVDVRDILAQRSILKDLLIKQEEDKRFYPIKGHTDIGGATKETTDNAILALQRLNHMIDRSLDWDEEDTSKIRNRKSKWYDKMKREFPGEFPEDNPWK
tara:strand:- start:984 stop:1652 length:669 start_codon:yes stop_codon:yes gene_type:complete